MRVAGRRHGGAAGQGARHGQRRVHPLGAQQAAGAQGPPHARLQHIHRTQRWVPSPRRPRSPCGSWCPRLHVPPAPLSPDAGSRPGCLPQPATMRTVHYAELTPQVVGLECSVFTCYNFISTTSGSLFQAEIVTHTFLSQKYLRMLLSSIRQLFVLLALQWSTVAYN